MATLSKKQFMALTPAERSKLSRPSRKRRQNKAQPAAKVVMMTTNAPRKRKRNRGGKGAGGVRTRNTPVANNQKRFIVPIDEQITLVNGNDATGTPTQMFVPGLNSYSLNPGNPLIFPFTSRTAQNYERYEFQNLKFEYKPSADVFATPGQQGFVGISATDDALQAPPSTQQIAEVFLHGPIVKTAQPTHLALSKKFMESSRKQMHFVRPNGLIPGGADPHLYDCGQVFFWATGQASTGQIGEYRVTGSVLLSNPVLETSTSPAPQFSMSQFTQAAATAMPATGVGEAIQFNAASPVNPLAIVNAGGIFTPPVGTYNVSVDIYWVNTTANAVGMDLTVNKNPGTGSQAQVGVQALGSSGALGPNYGGGLSWNYLVSFNGTDTLACDFTPTYAAGAPTFGAQISFNAV